MTYIEKVKNIVKNSSLKEEEKEEFYNIFSFVDDKFLEGLIGIFEKEPKWVPIFYYNLKAKRLAAKLNDPQVWDRIFQMEKEMFEKME